MVKDRKTKGEILWELWMMMLIFTKGKSIVNWKCEGSNLIRDTLHNYLCMKRLSGMT